ncbi:hypothetical protein M3Y94_01241200 [Aphelenchoides besseyi]|nr:hypothetical protein M3Y94_01241200 [Aphelenchoides besseyi]
MIRKSLSHIDNFHWTLTTNLQLRAYVRDILAPRLLNNKIQDASNNQLSNMSNRKTNTENVPTTIHPNMMADIENILKSQGIEMDAEALTALNQLAGNEFEKTYKKIAHEKADEAKASGDDIKAAQIEADVEDESMEQEAEDDGEVEDELEETEDAYDSKDGEPKAE